MIKILSANEFKQLYGVPPTLKKISPEVFNNVVRCHTLPRTNVTGITKKVINSNLLQSSSPSSLSTQKILKKMTPTLGNYKLKYDPSTFQTATTTVPTNVVNKNN